MNSELPPTEDPAPDRAPSLVELPEGILAQVEAELAAHGGSTAGDPAAQRAAEARILEILRAEQFTGPRFERLFGKMAHRLVGYAFPIMRHWIGSGHIFDECLKFRRPIIKQARAAASEWTLEEQEAFAIDSIIGTDAMQGGVQFFLNYGLRKGNWDPQKGASSGTYFVGACACCFASFCNKWWKDKVLAEAMLSSPAEADEEGEDLLQRIADTSVDPADAVVLRDSAARAMAQVKDPKIQEVLLRRSYLGQTQAEAATAVDLTPKAVERRLHTHRKNMRDDDDQGRP
ncbi:Uncharacterised protein [Amycolatopsis camponoti]|uniref:Uncharacterized protein n=1 Tax=Amycolatopsis camponoti TaxID=2606593 RepID=A0A6I8M527_9PSEU|nr:sigma-70 family RNA polymerase sigma factor [Amycolatopsis camponoti]VVJ22743.1 Uncharacterised protein [Amycolatopsis camponoti]